MTKATTTTKAIATIPSFESGAGAVMRALRRFDKVSDDTSITIAAAFQTYLDGVDVPKEKVAIDQLGGAIRDAFKDAIGVGTIERKTVTEYAQSAMRAYFYGVPFEQGLKNDSSLALPWSKVAKSGTAEKAGPVQSTTREALDATIIKALAQARMLGLTEFAATVLDVCLERLDGFKEPESAKL